MCHNMSFEVTNLCAGKVALVAIEGPFSGIGEHVFLEITTSCTWVIELFAIETPFSWMFYHVLSEVITICTGIVALFATEMLFSWMCQHVSLKTIITCEGIVALFAIEFFLLNVSACVSWDYHHLRRNYCIGCIWNTFPLNVSACVSWGWHNLWRNNCIGCIWKASWHYELACDVSNCQGSHLQSRTGCSCEASVKHALGSLNLQPCWLSKFWCFALL